MITTKKIEVFGWFLGSLVTVLAIIVWATHRLGNGALSAYDVFPLLGLLAFSLMWTMYIIGAVKVYTKQPQQVLARYFKVTSALVLFLIIFHPGILIVSLFLDGFGLPPISYLTAYDSTIQRFALVLGTASLLAFLLFELYRWFSQKSWWKYINYLNIVAMFAIFVHGLSLGGELAIDWFKVVWWIYGVTLLLAVVYTLKLEWRAHE